ncbi:MAG TPA: alpha-amylase family protein [Ornithinibacter sp.]|nr:alpha-amylase family protein [Ornithinibacter sp.]
MTPTRGQEAEALTLARTFLVEEYADHDALDVLARLDRWLPDLVDGLDAVYEEPGLLQRVVDLALRGHLARPERLRAHDRQRVLRPDWFQLPSCIGYAAYVDRFAGDLQGVRARVPYLAELGVTYLHLMPLLQPRPAPNDGGYAVADYRAVRSDLGTMADLAELADTLHEQGMALTLDLVLNHVAREHEWARRARAGEERYRRYFRLFPDRTEPDAFEVTLPEVFPATAPGSFTWDDEAAAWVWTTFNTWQWDLDWSNPDVFCEFVDIIVFLANQGVDCLRLDAIAFLWKRLGTNSQNQPEVHAITQALRAVARIAAPSLVFKAEAIVGPDQLMAYLGSGEHAGKVSDVAYHNSLMVQIWSALAARDARLMVRALGRFPPKPTTAAWGTYLRCHDDIGWAIDDVDTAGLGWTGSGHRSFLSDFYSGEAPGSFARGAVFQHNEETGDRRISGSAASLAGVEAALEDQDDGALTLALARLACAHAMVFGFGGIPLVYMGDELALLNDREYVGAPEHADDNRWLHRPAMPWSLAEQRRDRSTVTGRAFASMQHLARTRAGLAALHASVETELFETGNQAVVVAVRRHAAGTLVEVFNVSEREQRVPAGAVAAHLPGPWVDELSAAAVTAEEGTLVLPPYAAWWLTGDIR